jgi:transposase
MFDDLSFSDFIKLYPNNDACLKEIVTIRYPDGITCLTCNKITTHYKLNDRLAYSCSVCRHQVYPLAGTIFEKTSTSLRLWFYAIFLMTHTKGEISAKQLQRELGVTYKTAWRMYKSVKKLMLTNKLLTDTETADTNEKTEGEMSHKWVFFKRFEISVVETQDDS